MRSIGAQVPEIPGTSASKLNALATLFEQAGFQEISTTTIEVKLGYADFHEFWSAQTPSYSPTTRIIQSMSERERHEFIARLSSAVPRGRNRQIEYAVTANAVKARV